MYFLESVITPKKYNANAKFMKKKVYTDKPFSRRAVLQHDDDV